MRLPNLQLAVVSGSKVVDYLLNLGHLDGRGKALFFGRCGFDKHDWKALAAALLEHAQIHEVSQVEDSPFGRRYNVEGELTTPSGKNPMVRTIWFIRDGELEPRLVTAYPIKRSRI